MNKVNIFISYATDDYPKMIFVKDLINECEGLNALVVPETKSDLDYSPDKVKKAFAKAKVFLPILTSNSINNQWVNQEIGYAFGITRINNIKPIVEKAISDKLKGFISKSNDLNYRFDDDEHFELIARDLVNDLKEKFELSRKYYAL